MLEVLVTRLLVLYDAHCTKRFAAIETVELERALAVL